MNTTLLPVSLDDKEMSCLMEVARAVRSIRFGSVEITIHDSQVVQVERREKVRFNRPGESKEKKRVSSPDRNGI